MNGEVNEALVWNGQPEEVVKAVLLSNLNTAEIEFLSLRLHRARDFHKHYELTDAAELLLKVLRQFHSIGSNLDSGELQ
jgi:hypothetical protein